jgi:hypothetical protein
MPFWKNWFGKVEAPQTQEKMPVPETPPAQRISTHKPTLQTEPTEEEEELLTYIRVGNYYVPSNVVEAIEKYDAKRKRKIPGKPDQQSTTQESWQEYWPAINKSLKVPAESRPLFGSPQRVQQALRANLLNALQKFSQPHPLLGGKFWFRIIDVDIPDNVPVSQKDELDAITGRKTLSVPITGRVQIISSKGDIVYDHRKAIG